MQNESDNLSLATVPILPLFHGLLHTVDDSLCSNDGPVNCLWSYSGGRGVSKR